MAQLMRTAAYVRRKPTLCGKRSDGCVDQRWVEARLNTMDLKIWQHLQTPHTVDSLTNVMSEAEELRARDAAKEIEMVLRRLLDRDLIELSPDS